MALFVILGINLILKIRFQIRFPVVVGFKISMDRNINLILTRFKGLIAGETLILDINYLIDCMD